MKKKLVFLFALFFFIGATAQQQGKYFFVKSGHVEYTFGGNTKGTKSVWFDNYGMLMCTITMSSSTVKMLGFTNTSEKKEVEIRKDNQIWKADLITKTGTKIDISAQTEVGEKLTVGKSDAQLHEMERKIIADMGGKIEGYETFLGRNCLKFTWGTTKFLQYKGIPLSSTVSEMGITYIETANSFESNIAVPSSKFELPQNIQFQDAGEMMDMLEAETE